MAQEVKRASDVEVADRVVSVPLKDGTRIFVGVKAEPVHEPTEAELKAELKKAYESGDFKAIAAVARKIDTAVKAKEKTELEAKHKALDAIKDKVANAISAAVKKLVDSGQLDAAEGIWYSYDFGEATPVIRLMRTAPKAARSSGGGGKKFNVSTEDMLAKHSTEEYKEGLTFQQGWESSTDKNFRYAIRLKLLKLEGIV